MLKKILQQTCFMATRSMSMRPLLARGSLMTMNFSKLSSFWDKYNPFSEPIEFFDPHFHIWDISKNGPHDGDILFKPHDKKCYDTTAYENDLAKMPKNFVHTGGVFLEAMSVCFPGRGPKKLNKDCLKEAS